MECDVDVDCWQGDAVQPESVRVLVAVVCLLGWLSELAPVLIWWQGWSVRTQNLPDMSE